jgi:predicted restriction endonuclease
MVDLEDVRGRMKRGGMTASLAQRAKVKGQPCIVCHRTLGDTIIDPAHLAARNQGGCDSEDCVVALCRFHHRAFDAGNLDLLPFLEPHHRAELAHALQHLGLVGIYRRVTNERLAA